MRGKNWHICKGEAGEITLARRIPARFDFVVETILPACNPIKLAHQIRQDIWRELKGLKGYSPVIEVLPTGNCFRVRAGGQVNGMWPRQHTQAVVSSVLNDPARRSRWVMHAGRAR